MNDTKQELDQWELALEKQVIIIQDCQKQHNVNSCSACDKFLNCSIREEYIKAVYESMNKGSGGGFEF